MISQETKQRILDATRIEDVIGDFVSLKKRGANHIGCCPFHNEKTPSFYVSPSKGIFKCFGCGESGDAVSFLMKHEHYTYPEALKWLAQKYNITIEEEQLTEEQQQRRDMRDSLFHVSEFAEKYFVETMMDTEIGQAVGLGYFHERGLSDEIIKKFGLGYSPDEWRAFTDYALKNGYSKEVLEKTGLTIFKDDGKMYDRFRGRVTFPIYSVSGRVLGFSCRILSKEKQAAKYVNSPDSDIYNKGHILYGLFQAKNAISRANKCYLVEGNLDVISMHQSGVENTVAPCGTSFTIDQVRLIKRYTPNVTIVFDSDAAGINATHKAANLLFSEGMKVRCVLFPDGDDPDSFAQRNGSTALQEYLAQHEENFILYKARITSEEIKRDPIRKSELVGKIVDSIALVPDLIERSDYIQQCASLFATPEQTLANNVAKAIALHKQQEWKLQQQQASGAQTDQPSADSQPQSDAAGPVVPVVQAPRQDEFKSLNPAEAQERNLIGVLIRFGDSNINWTYTNIEGKEVTELMPVASVIVSTVLSAKLSFANPLYQKVFDQCLEALKQEKIITATQFAASDDAEVRDLAISLMVQPYEVSERWLTDKGIATPSEQQRLPSDVRDSLLHFRLKKVESEMDACLQQLKTEPDEDMRMALVQRFGQLQKVKKAIGQDLRIVITAR
ncbi:MAG: DNA primase [Bacteroidales bacterium]|nr:DNA primase [Bacteroidales bacterium]